MKKHELLKYAYDNYPKGTVAKFKTAPNVEHISNGKFHIFDDGIDYHVCGGDNSDCFYSNKEWAEIVSINKIQPIEVQLSCERHLATVSKEEIKIRVGTALSNTTTYFIPSDIEAIWKAYQSLLS